MLLVSEESAKSCFTVGNLDNLTFPVGIIVGGPFNSVNHYCTQILTGLSSYYSSFIYGSVSQGLGTTKLTNLIG